MYSGTTLRTKSGKILGAHQKFDRIARRALRKAAPELKFPKISEILYFEGLNGPDGIKRKSPGKDEPWHFYDPEKKTPEFLAILNDHRANLIKALAENNRERAAFEAAWYAHALVDGLTPAHHYPYEEVIEGIRGQDKETRDTVLKKLIYPGAQPREVLRNNWYIYGAGGTMTTHGLFELGVAAAIKTFNFKKSYPGEKELQRVLDKGIELIFIENAREIHNLKMYASFMKRGWTSRLAKQTRQDLAPLIVKTLTLAWYEAAWQANNLKQESKK